MFDFIVSTILGAALAILFPLQPSQDKNKTECIIVTQKCKMIAAIGLLAAVILLVLIHLRSPHSLYDESLPHIASAILGIAFGYLAFNVLNRFRDIVAQGRSTQIWIGSGLAALLIMGAVLTDLSSYLRAFTEVKTPWLELQLREIKSQEPQLVEDNIDVFTSVSTGELSGFDDRVKQEIKLADLEEKVLGPKHGKSGFIGQKTERDRRDLLKSFDDYATTTLYKLVKHARNARARFQTDEWIRGQLALAIQSVPDIIDDMSKNGKVTKELEQKFRNEIGEATNNLGNFNVKESTAGKKPPSHFPLCEVTRYIGNEKTASPSSELLEKAIRSDAFHILISRIYMYLKDVNTAYFYLERVSNLELAGTTESLIPQLGYDRQYLNLNWFRASYHLYTYQPRSNTEKFLANVEREIRRRSNLLNAVTDSCEHTAKCTLKNGARLVRDDLCFVQEQSTRMSIARIYAHDFYLYSLAHSVLLGNEPVSQITYRKSKARFDELSAAINELPLKLEKDPIFKRSFLYTRATWLLAKQKLEEPEERNNSELRDAISDLERALHLATSHLPASPSVWDYEAQVRAITHRSNFGRRLRAAESLLSHHN